MSELNDALLYLDLDKGGEAAGPLFDEPRRRLAADPALRAGWNQYQALRALALESAPEPGEKLLRLALTECRRERVKQQLARTAGSEDLAREILLGRVAPEGGRRLPAWAWGAGLMASAGLLWLLLGPQIQALLWPEDALMLRTPPQAAQPLPALDDENVPFEFPAQTPPASAALEAPTDAPAPVGDVREDSRAAQQARRLMQAHLQGRNSEAAPTAIPTRQPSPSAPRNAPTKPVPIATLVRQAIPVPDPQLVENGSAVPTLAPPTAVPTAVPTTPPTAVPTTVPTAIPTAVPTAIPTVAPTAVPTAAAKVDEASFSLAAPQAKRGGMIEVSLGLPERRDVDLRLFDQRGRPIKGILSGDQGPGLLRLPLTLSDEAGQALPLGTYYLRVMTPWFSRVEPIEITD